MPEGFPWKIRSHAMACSRTSSSDASGATERAIATPSAAEHPSPPPAGSSVLASTSTSPSERVARTDARSARNARPRSRSSSSVTSVDHVVTRRTLDALARATAVAPRSIPRATAGTPWTTACSPARINFPHARPGLVIVIPLAPRARWLLRGGAVSLRSRARAARSSTTRPPRATRAALRRAPSRPSRS